MHKDREHRSPPSQKRTRSYDSRGSKIGRMDSYDREEKDRRRRTEKREDGLAGRDDATIHRNKRIK